LAQDTRTFRKKGFENLPQTLFIPRSKRFGIAWLTDLVIADYRRFFYTIGVFV
jgi:hypothetical protein